MLSVVERMRRIRRAGDVLVLLSGGMAGVALWSWIAGIGDLFTLSTLDKPTSPTTNLLLLLISTSAFALGRWPGRRATRLFCWLAVVVVAGGGLMALARPWLGPDFSLEASLVSGVGQVISAQSPLMSRFAGAAVTLLAGAMGMRLASGGRRSSLNLAAYSISALVGMICGFVAISGVMRGAAPLVGGERLISVWSAAGCSFTGFAMWCLLVASNRHFKHAPSAKPPGGRTVSGLSMILVSGTAGLVIAVAGAAYLRYSLTQERADAQALLKVIGDLKVAQIASWRAERLSDARFFSEADFVARDAAAFFANPADEQARAEALRWLKLLKSGDRYKSIGLYDTNLALRLSVPAQDTATATWSHPPEMARILAQGGVDVIDLHIDADQHSPHMAIVLPVFTRDHDATNASVPVRSAIGLVLMRIDPARFLYPLIRNLPTQSLSLETVLLRREGDDVLFLNELRHRPGVALTQRLSIKDHQNVPGVMAVQGQLGLVEGVDYRGVPVLAATCRVPDSPWFAVTKVDRAEIFAPLYQQARVTLLLTALISLAACIIARLFWKKREADFVRLELGAERSRRMLAERVEHLMKGANDAIIVANQKREIIEWNDRALELYGYSPVEMTRLTLSDLRPVETREDFTRVTGHGVAHDGGTFEMTCQRKNGTQFPAEVSIRTIEVGDEHYDLDIIRDISRRKAQEREIARLSRLYETLGKLNETLVRMKSREELFAEACRIIVECAAFKLVWIGLVNDESREVVPVARAGDSDGYLDEIKVFADDRPEGRGPTGTCIRENRPSVFNDFLNDARGAPWRNAARKHGLAAIIGLPLRVEGRVLAAMTVYSGEANVFQDKEILLLERIAADMSFALDHLLQEQRKRAAENQTRAVLSAIPDLLFRIRNDGVILDHHTKDAGDLYVPPEQFLGRNIRDILPVAIVEQTLAAMAKAAATKEAVAFGYELEIKGRARFFENRIVALSDTESLSVIRNVTAEKRADMALRESEERFRVLVDSVSNIAVQGYSPDGTVRLWNRASEEIYGYTAAEAIGRNLVDLIIPPEMKDDVRAAIAQMMNEKQHRSAEELSLMRKNGSRVPVYSNHTVIEVSGRGKELYCIDIDLTERKRAAAALTESNARYRSLFENMLNGFAYCRMIYDEGHPKDFIYISVNSSFERLTGLRNVAGKKASEAIPGIQEADPDLLARYGRVATTGVPEQFEIYVTAMDMWFTISAYCPEKDHFVAVFDVITERKRAEAALLASEARFQQMTACIDDVLYCVDGLTSEFTYISPAFQRLLGYSPDDVTAMGGREKFLDHVIQDDAFQEQMDVFRSLIRGSSTESQKRWETWWRCKDGELKCIDDRWIPIFSDGNLVATYGVLRDVTGNKRAEERLQVMNYAVASSPNALGLSDMKGIITYVNDAFVRMWGYKHADEIVGRTFVELSASKELVAEIIESLLAGHERTGEGTAYRNDGTIFQVEFAASRVRTSTGKMVAMMASFVDTTERKLQQNTLRLQSAALEAAANTIVITDRDGRILWATPSFTSITGYSLQEALGKDPGALINSGQHDEAFYRQLWATILAGRVWHGEVTNKRKDGRIYAEEMTITPLKNEAGEITHFIAIKQDITERREIEMRMRERAALLDMAFEAISVHDLDDKVTYWNKSAEKTYGIGGAEAQGRNIHDLIPVTEVERIRLAREATLSSGQWIGEFPVAIGGQTRFIESTWTLIRDAGGTAKSILAMDIDVTERKEYESRLAQMQRMESLGTLASGIAHDFNNDLMPILGLADVLLTTPGALEDQAEVRSALQTISEAAMDAREIVRRLREFYRPGENLEVSEVNLNKIADAAISLTQPRWKAQSEAEGCQIRMLRFYESKATLLANEGQLREVFTNLLLNAIDAMPDGGTITINTYDLRDFVVTEVSDTGVGMSADVRIRCIEPFFTTKGVLGTGLGLSMCHGIIQEHDGLLEIESEPGQGTTVRIMLPLRHPHAEKKTCNGNRGERAPKAIRVLFIDDDQDLCNLVLMFLNTGGYVAEAVSNGPEGLERLRAAPFDILITDRAMPQMSGDLVAIEAKKIAPDMPVLMFTGFGGISVTNENLPPGVDAVAGKPSTRQELLEAIQNLLDRTTVV